MWELEENNMTMKQYIVCDTIINNLGFKSSTSKNNILTVTTNTAKYIIKTKSEARDFINKYIDESKAKRIENIKISNFEEDVETEGLIEHY